MKKKKVKVKTFTSKFVYTDGGRSKYFKTKGVGDCGVRAIANATGKDYLEIYNSIKEIAQKERISKYKKTKSNPRNGLDKYTEKTYLESIGWEYVSATHVGVKANKTLLLDHVVPKRGTYIVRLYDHLTCIKNGIIHDTWNCALDRKEVIYGY